VGRPVSELVDRGDDGGLIAIIQNLGKGPTHNFGHSRVWLAKYGSTGGEMEKEVSPDPVLGGKNGTEKDYLQKRRGS